MSRTAKLSVVLPVHNAQSRIAAEVERVLEALSELTHGAVEIILVDDGSRDATAEVLDELRTRYPQVRIARHNRRLGMEAAGQTGLERATGDLVFIQEDDSPVRLADLRQLYHVGRDETVVAARAQSQLQPSQGPLLRRLKAWGAAAAESLRQDAAAEPIAASSTRGLQMVRRPHLQLLASRSGSHLRLEAEHLTTSQCLTPAT
ncbi:glycosyltransferase family 2 protein [Candidatus Laterigemmans baculatus]|uniref:glycosyltransferase family 2 protein n=1 Tax=Candidatus Laterigemmans baculatus TaxID=2770505 RepID=UPI0013DA9BA0|nr:glycosyltransferase family 2 protein [Candidatus Laterigemmans baculatus]